MNEWYDQAWTTAYTVCAGPWIRSKSHCKELTQGCEVGSAMSYTNSGASLNFLVLKFEKFTGVYYRIYETQQDLNFQVPSACHEVVQNY